MWSKFLEITAGDMFSNSAKTVNGIKQQGCRERVRPIKIHGFEISEGEHYSDVHALIKLSMCGKPFHSWTTSTVRKKNQQPESDQNKRNQHPLFCFIYYLVAYFVKIPRIKIIYTLLYRVNLTSNKIDDMKTNVINKYSNTSSMQANFDRLGN